jgi:hypothetical protein
VSSRGSLAPGLDPHEPWALDGGVSPVSLQGHAGPFGAAPGADGFVQVVELPLAKAVAKALGGEITAATTVLGLLLVSGGAADGCA